MTNFSKIYTEFEKTINLVEFEKKYSDNKISTRFLLIRSLDSKDLEKILKNKDISCNKKKHLDLMKAVYDSEIDIPYILNYIESRRNNLIIERENELDKLPDLITKLPIVKAGIRDDKVDSIIKEFVRNKNIKEYSEFEKELENKIIPRFKNYVIWSYFNQTTNDIIELYFLKNKKIIPTLRKIPNIDFFVKFDDENIIPFDLKVTHISDNYFDLAFQGIVANTDSQIKDSYTIKKENLSELEYIKEFYKSIKKEHNLPNYGKLSKYEIISILENINSCDTNNFIKDLKEQHRKLVPSTDHEIKKLEWWNYKYQGERLFSNNNRIFLFFAYKNEFVDARRLKGNIDKLEELITTMLDGITLSKVHTINYKYEKDKEKNGEYECSAFSTLYFE